MPSLPINVQIWSKRLSAFFAVALLFSRHTIAGIAETEPNNTHATANTLLFDANGRASVDTAKISSLSDIDDFKITTPVFGGTTTLTVTMTPTSSDGSLDAKLSLASASGTVLVTADSGFDNSPETLTFTVAGNTTYYVSCGSADLFSLGAGDYRLAVSVNLNDLDDQIAEAIPLGSVIKTLVAPMPSKLDLATDVDMYSFVAVAGQRISFNVDCPGGALSAYLCLFTATGDELAHNSGGPAPGEGPAREAYLEYTFTVSGSYYVSVSGLGNSGFNPITGGGDTDGSTGSYVLTLSPGLSGAISRDPAPANYPVDIVRYGSTPLAIDPTIRTWIVIHGWNSSRTNDNIAALTTSLAQARPQDQILTLDWSSAADTGLTDPFSAESSILPVAQWAAVALARAGFNGTNLNLVGHSFGSYVSDEIAKRIGGVDSIVTLDPAADIVGGFNPNVSDEIDFARDSDFSWSFHSSNLGSDITPLTADESFIVDTGHTVDQISAHSDVVFLFAYFLSHAEDPLSQYFLLGFLLNDQYGPWIPDQFASIFLFDTNPTIGYEAEIVADGSNRAPAAVEFVSIETDVSTLSISEGSIAPLRVRLSRSPATAVNVQVQRSFGATNIFVANQLPLTFTSANGDAYQDVLVSAAISDHTTKTATIQCSVGGRGVKNVIVTELPNIDLITRPTLSHPLVLDGQVQFQIQGDVVSIYVLQFSNDLLTWTPFATNTISGLASGAFPYSSTTPKAFVRAIIPTAAP